METSQTSAGGPAAPGFTVRAAPTADLAVARAPIMRVIEEDMGYEHDPARHWDVDDPQGVDLDRPRQPLFVGVDDARGDLIGTAAVRRGGLKSPPSPVWLAERYDPERTAERWRVYVSRAHRHRGVARALVGAARRVIAADARYTTISLHTDPRSPGAEPFWRVMPSTVYDTRGQGGPFETLYPETALADDPE